MKNRAAILKIVGAAVFFIFAIAFANQMKESAGVLQLVQRFSYFGVLLLAFVSGFNVVVPVPAMSFLPVFSEAGLETAAVVAVVSVGMTFGDGVGFLLGKYGRESVARASLPAWIRRIESFCKRHTYGPALFLLFYAGFVPFPNELIVVPLAASGLKWWMVMLPVLLGNIILNTLIALGISSIIA